jgi:hypothetical protein
MAQALVKSAGRILGKQVLSEEKNQETFNFSAAPEIEAPTLEE